MRKGWRLRCSTCPFRFRCDYFGSSDVDDKGSQCAVVDMNQPWVTLSTPSGFGSEERVAQSFRLGD